jgi:hypothetical protein
VPYVFIFRKRTPMTRQFVYRLLLAALIIFFASCSDDPEAPVVPDDNAAPSNVTDLAAVVEGDSIIVLTWSAPGGDGNAGKASAYDIRYSTSLVNTQSWDNASQAQGEPAPKDPGLQERFSVPGLAPDSSYYFRLKTRDQAANTSDLSNVALADVDPPAKILDLTALDTTARSVTLWWTEPWDNGFTVRASSYEIRYAGESITEGNWESATIAPDPPVPGVSGGHATFLISGLEPDSLLYVAVRSVDGVGNLSPLSNILAVATSNSGWSSFGPAYPNNTVVTMLPTDGILFVGGQFTEVGSVPASRIAKWNGSEWAAIGAGFSGGSGTTQVSVLAFYGTQLVAGGMFGSSGGTPTANVARWAGSAWQPFGTGTDGGIIGIATLGVDLFVGGIFWEAGGNQGISACARWDGTRWNTMGFHYPQALAVAEMIIFNGDLIAGGSFGYASATLANHIARWDGSAWHSFGTGFINGDPVTNVTALGVYEGDLIAGGKFQQSGATEVNNIARWDGTAWQAMGLGLGNDPGTDAVSHMTVYNGDLIVVGRFTMAGGVSANNIARWNGSSWAAMGSGITGPDPWSSASAVVVWDGSLYVGGAFDTAGGATTPFLAKWEE